MFSGTRRRERTSAYRSSSKEYKLCGSELPPVISSSGHEMTVVLVSDASIASRGFQARWDSLQDAECGGSLSQTGVISPPLVGGNYTNDTLCTWSYVNPHPTNSTLVLSAPGYSLEAPYNTYCRYDWLQVRGGEGEETADNPRLCGQSQSAYTVASPLPQTRIVFRTDGTITDKGFNMSYSLSPCGGILTGPTAVITSPNFPANYPNNVTCLWLLRFSPGSQIELRTAAFSLDTDCQADNVTVRNGGEADSPVLWSGCGQTVPPSLLSQSNVVTVQFVSDRRNNNSGFNLTAVEHTAGCGGLLHGMAGSIVSPRSEGSSKYPDGAECVWEILSEPGYHTKIVFTGRFDLEQSVGCESDYLEVQSWNVTTNSWRQVGERICGRTLPDPVSTPTAKTRIIFRSNRAVNGDGFSLHWSLDCGGVFYSPSGTFSSPGYPAGYDNNINCNYTIVTPGPDFIVANFVETFSVERGRQCSYDRVTVMEAETGNTRGVYCGDVAPDSVSTRGGMIVNFKTDNSIKRAGFKVSWATHQCGGEMSEEGEIRSPVHPDSYFHNTNCTWVITAPPGQVVEIKFDLLELESHSRCRYDYVAVYDGARVNTSRLIGQYCGNQTVQPPVLKSHDNVLTLQFKTDGSRSYRGFRAVSRFTYGSSRGCGGLINITESSKSISSLDVDGDGQYEPDLNCHWTVVGPADKVVKMRFTSFDLGNTFNTTLLRFN